MSDPKTDFEMEITKKIAADPDKARNVGAVYLFRISGEKGGTWTLNLRDDVGVKNGPAEAPDCTIELSDSDWERVSSDPNAAMQLYFQGRLKASGNIMLATRLQHFLK